MQRRRSSRDARCSNTKGSQSCLQRKRRRAVTPPTRPGSRCCWSTIRTRRSSDRCDRSGTRSGPCCGAPSSERRSHWRSGRARKYPGCALARRAGSAVRSCSRSASGSLAWGQRGSGWLPPRPLRRFKAKRALPLRSRPARRQLLRSPSTWLAAARARRAEPVLRWYRATQPSSPPTSCRPSQERPSCKRPSHERALAKAAGARCERRRPRGQRALRGPRERVTGEGLASGRAPVPVNSRPQFARQIWV